MYASAEDIVSRSLRSAFTTRRRLSVSQWAETHRVVTMSARKGKWDNSLLPYLTEIMDSWSDPTVRMLVIMKSAQSGGTEAMFNMLLRDVTEDPAPTMFGLPTLSMVRKVNTRRFLPTARAIDAVREEMSASARDANQTETVFNRSWLNWVACGSAASTESFPIQRVFIDEFDRCDPETLERAIERTKTFEGTSKICIAGTPGFAGEGIDRVYSGSTSTEDDENTDEDELARATAAASDQRRYWVPCIVCGNHYTHEFEQVRWIGGLRARPDEVRLSAWYVCPHCQGRNTAATHGWQLRHGVWVPKGVGVLRLVAGDRKPLTESKQLLGGHLDRTPPFNSTRGYHIVGLMSALEANPYGAVAAKFIKAKGQRTATFVTSVLGLPESKKGLSANVKDLLAKRSAYVKGTVPEGVIAITAAVDVQGDRVYYEVLGWHAYGKRCSLIDYRMVNCDPKGKLGEIDAILKQTYPTADGGRMRIHSAAIDSGHQTDDVYNCVRRVRKFMKFSYATKGAGGRQTGTWPWKESKINEEDEQPLLLHINTEYWKTHALKRLSPKAAAEGPKDWATFFEQAATSEETGPLSVEEPDVWEFPAETEQAYFSQLTAEHRVLVRSRNGRVRFSWEMKPGRDHNHYFDCRVANCALADRMRIPRLKPRPKATPQPAAPSVPVAQKPPQPWKPPIGMIKDMRKQER